MRILHTADWHLGRTLHGEDLHSHQEAFLDHLVAVAREERVAAVVVAGGVYDRAIPPVTAVELLAEALQRLSETAHVILTPGNHDSASRLGFAAPLLRDGVRILSRVSGVATPVVVPASDGGEVLVYGLPYLDPDVVRFELAERPGDTLARSHEAVVGAAMERVRADLAARRQRAARRLPAVVMAHAFVTGGEASDSERDIRVGGADSVPFGVFSGTGAEEVDYVALGHLHGPQRVSPEGQHTLGRYSGSPLAYSFSEQHHRKSSAIVRMTEAGVAEVELIPAPQPRRLSEVRGTLAEVCSPRFASQADDWVRVTVTDDHRPAGMVGAVRERFPHALIVRHVPATAPRQLSPQIQAAHDPLDVVSDFVTAVSGHAPDPAEQRVLRAAYEAVLAEERSA